jgi:hypothetical protein
LWPRHNISPRQTPHTNTTTMNPNNANSTRFDVDNLIAGAICLMNRQRIKLLKTATEAASNNDKGVASWAGEAIRAVDQRKQVM